MPVDIDGWGTAPQRYGRSADRTRRREGGPSGALLARPDTVVARRRSHRPADPRGALRAARTQLAGGPVGVSW